jgi:hypothetical protein
MDWALHRTPLEIGVLGVAAVAVATCVFFVTQPADPPRPPTAAPTSTAAPPRTGFTVALPPPVHTTEAKEKAKKAIADLHPDDRKKLDDDLRPVAATLRVPQNMRLDVEYEVTLAIDVTNPPLAAEVVDADGTRTIPVEIKVATSKPTNQVVAWLAPLGTKAKVTARHDAADDRRDVTADAPVKWSWVVEPKESGYLRLETATWVTVGSPPRSIRHDHPDKDFSISVAIMDRVWNAAGQAWSIALAIMSGLGVIAGGLGSFHLLSKWRQRGGGGDAEVST